MRINVPDILLFLLAAFTFVFATSCNPSKSNTSEITIATASNMQFVINSLAEEFTQMSGTKCHVVVSSSGKLTTQLIEGAPYDVFVSADMKYPSKVHNHGKAVNPPKIYAYGKLVLWSMNKDIKTNLNSLIGENINRIAIANPKLAPYGAAGIEALSHLASDSIITPKLVFAENVSQANQYILSKAVEIGFTSLSTVKSPRLKEKGHWTEIDKNLYTPIGQGAIVVKRKNGVKKEALLFNDFLFSNKAKKLLTSYGYSVNE